MDRNYEELSGDIKSFIDEVLKDYEGFIDYSFQVVLDYHSKREFSAYPSDKSQAITVKIVFEEDRNGIKAKFKVKKNSTPLKTYILDGYNGEDIIIDHKKMDSKDYISEKAIREGIMSMVRYTKRFYN